LHRKTVTRADLVEALSREVELRASVCADLLEDVLDLIAERLAAGEPVGIVNFGSFSVRHKGARMGRNPKTGEPAPIAPRRVVVSGVVLTAKSRHDPRTAAALRPTMAW
jgi:integration host factor subunit alpha